ncbi:MAG: DUF3795 domain-containing protein [Candidatus Izemoplasmatales bacterium]
MTRVFESYMIAPCGIDCATCAAFSRKKNRCPGCMHPSDEGKGTHALKCSIKNCPKHPAGGRCDECASFPCATERRIDMRYRTSWRESLIGTLSFLHEHGLEKALERERTRWVCPACGSDLSVHALLCPACGRERPTFGS